MKNKFTYLMTMIAGLSIAMPALSQTKEADQRYCNALVNSYKQAHGQVLMRGNQPISLEITKAMEGCQHGDTAGAIPVLERYLRDMRIDLPPR